jgi:hypothetical protein
LYSHSSGKHPQTAIFRLWWQRSGLRRLVSVTAAMVTAAVDPAAVVARRPIRHAIGQDVALLDPDGFECAVHRRPTAQEEGAERVSKLTSLRT